MVGGGGVGMQERKGQEVFRKKWGWGIGGADQLF